MNDLTNLFAATAFRMDLFWGVVLLTIVFALIIGFILIKKGSVWAIITSFIMGLILLLLFGLVHHWNGDGLNDEVVSEVKSWYLLIGKVFVTLIVIMLPIYIFTIVINFLLSENVATIRVGTYFVSFASLIGMAILGIIIALIVSPILFILSDSIWDGNFNIIGEGEEEGGGVIGLFTSWWLILIIIVSAIYIGLCIRAVTNKTPEKRSNIKLWFSKLLNVINKYFKFVVLLVPFAILTNLSTIGMDDVNGGSEVAMLITYMLVWWIGSIIIFIVLFISNIIMSKADITTKEKAAILMEQTIVSFATQSTQAALPETQKTSMKLGVCAEISELTPTKGTIMGMVMCNGYSPALMLFFVLMMNGHGEMDWGLLVAGIGMIIVMAISTSGQGSADYTILTTTFSVLGVDALFGYYMFLLPVQEINERTIRTSNNTLGHILATQITERSHSSKGKCK